MNIQHLNDISFSFLQSIKKDRRGIKNLLYTFLYNLHLDYSLKNLNKHIQHKLYPTLKEKSKLFSYIFNIATKSYLPNKDTKEFS
jgi:hypothetical protein